jgi:hypothetical protein
LEAECWVGSIFKVEPLQGRHIRRSTEPDGIYAIGDVYTNTVESVFSLLKHGAVDLLESKPACTCGRARSICPQSSPAEQASHSTGFIQDLRFIGHDPIREVCPLTRLSQRMILPFAPQLLKLRVFLFRPACRWEYRGRPLSRA